MRRLIAAINMTLDGFCDHTAGIVDDEIHQHYNELLKSADTLLYGRRTYQLMESYWPSVVKNPTGNRPIDEFAILIGNKRINQSLLRYIHISIGFILSPFVEYFPEDIQEWLFFDF